MLCVCSHFRAKTGAGTPLGICPGIRLPTPEKPLLSKPPLYWYPSTPLFKEKRKEEERERGRPGGEESKTLVSNEWQVPGTEVPR